GASWQLLGPAHFEPDAGNDLEQPQLEAPVDGERRHGPTPRREEERASEHDEQRRRHIEENMEEQRARHRGWHRYGSGTGAVPASPPRNFCTSLVAPSRASAGRYF